jgi:hypothetical protein
MTENIVLIDKISQVAHEVNRAYCLSLGDKSQVSWHDAPDWQRESAYKGVKLHLANPDTTPEQSHESWSKEKIADGWKYGPVKNAETKEHPCLVPYWSLLPDQRAKDFIFSAVVREVREILGEG